MDRQREVKIQHSKNKVAKRVSKYTKNTKLFQNKLKTRTEK